MLANEMTFQLKQQVFLIGSQVQVSREFPGIINELPVEYELTLHADRPANKKKPLTGRGFFLFCSMSMRMIDYSQLSTNSSIIVSSGTVAVTVSSVCGAGTAEAWELSTELVWVDVAPVAVASSCAYVFPVGEASIR